EVKRMSEYQRATQQEAGKSSQNTPPISHHKKMQPESEHNKKQYPRVLQRLLTVPGSVSPRDILALQSVIGNRRLGQIIQTKLSIGPARDRYEQEADKIAREINQFVDNGGKMRPTPANITHSLTHVSQISPQSAGPGDNNEAVEGLEHHLKSSQSGGEPLPDTMRALMETQFNKDFSQVRVHTDNQAGQFNQGLGAEAFTHGHHIYMAQGRYQPGSNAGRQLLAHELTHVVQQGGNSQGKQPSSAVQCNRHHLPASLTKNEDDEKRLLNNAAPNTALTNSAHSPISFSRVDSFGARPNLQPSAANAPKPWNVTRPSAPQAAKPQNQGGLINPASILNPVIPKPAAPQRLGNKKADARYEKPAPLPKPGKLMQSASYHPNPHDKHRDIAPVLGMSRLNPAYAPTLTLPKRAEYETETQANGYWSTDASNPNPTYYQPQDKPNPYALEVSGGKIRHQGGEVLDTQGAVPGFLKDKFNRHMFTMGSKGDLYSADVTKEKRIHGRVHHTTMSGGQEQAAAGELRVNQGKLEAVSDGSGHYQPGTAMTYQALKNFETRGVDLSSTHVELSGKGKGQKTLNLSATELLSYQPEMEAALANAREYRKSNPINQENEGKVRGILSAPEKKIRELHGRKDAMQQELLNRTAGIRAGLDKSSPAAVSGEKDVTSLSPLAQTEERFLAIKTEQERREEYYKKHNYTSH
ncbi:MAG: DUF4157 domain-containing protein, partial [Methylocystaceae bacterium]